MLTTNDNEGGKFIFTNASTRLDKIKNKID